MIFFDNAPPVFRDGFCYGAFGLAWDPKGNGTGRHRRADAAYLHTLAHPPAPVLTKAGKVAKRQPVHPQQSINFYTAQLRHYGLGAAKSEDEAKAILRRAFDGTKMLTVPTRMLHLERDLRVEVETKEARWREQQEKAAIEEEKRQQAAEAKRAAEDAALIKQLLGSAKLPKPAKLAVQDLSGTYRIISPELGNTWTSCSEADALTLTISPSSTGAHLWGSFDFAILTGPMRSSMSTAAIIANRGEVRFHWRGEEAGEGETTYEAHNIVTLQLLDGGKCRGTLLWPNCSSKVFNFAGERGDSEPLSRDRLAEVKHEYRRTNEERHRWASSARWGGWSTDPRPDAPADSDTSDDEPSASEAGTEGDMRFSFGF